VGYLQANKQWRTIIGNDSRFEIVKLGGMLADAVCSFRLLYRF